MGEETREVRCLPLDQLKTDGGTQCREGLSETHVAALIDLMEGGIELDPVEAIWDGTYFWLFDGFHRLSAHERLGIPEIQTVVTPGDLSDALIASASANKNTSLPRTNADKRKAVTKMLELRPEWSNERIAKHCGVAGSFVGSLRKNLYSEASSLVGVEIPSQRLVSRNGKTFVMDTSTIGKKKSADSPAKGLTFEEVAELYSDIGEVVRVPNLARPYRFESIPTGIVQPFASLEDAKQKYEWMEQRVRDRISCLETGEVIQVGQILFYGARALEVTGLDGEYARVKFEDKTCDRVRITDLNINPPVGQLVYEEERSPATRSRQEESSVSFRVGQRVVSISGPTQEYEVEDLGSSELLLKDANGDTFVMPKVLLLPAVERGGSSPMDVFGSAQSAEHYTPKEIIGPLMDCFGGEIGCDPCSNSKTNPNIPANLLYTKEDNGLEQEWWGTTYCNCPWTEILTDEKGNPIQQTDKDGKLKFNKKGEPMWKTRNTFGLWLPKAIAEVQSGRVPQLVFLVKGDTSTAGAGYYGYIWKYAQAICMVDHRLTFSEVDSAAPFSVHFAYFGPDWGDTFYPAFRELGQVVSAWGDRIEFENLLTKPL